MGEGEKHTGIPLISLRLSGTSSFSEMTAGAALATTLVASAAKDFSMINKTKPLFSVVIPTRNRPEYLKDAIASITGQTFADWELIVSDNSDEVIAQENRSYVSTVADDRIRYVRPDKILPMVNHWEFAFGHANGTYVGVLTDRMALRLYTLERLLGIVERKSPTAICYYSQYAIELPAYFGVTLSRDAGQEIAISTRAKLKQFSQGVLTKDTPRGLNSFIRSDILENLRSRRGKIFGGIAPDYFLTFALMDEVEEYTYLHSPLLIVQGESVSNGRAFSIGASNDAIRDFVSQYTAEQRDILASCGPIPGDVSVISNIMLREYDTVARESISGKMSAIDPIGFYEHAAKHAAMLARHGNLSEATRETLRAYASTHQLQPISIPRNLVSPGMKAKVADVIKGRVDVPIYAPLARATRRTLDSALLHAKRAKVVSGKTLPEALAKDAIEARHFLTAR